MLFFFINSSCAMSMNEMLNTTFPVLTNQDWEKKAEESLKGKPVSTLANDTYEKIKLKPLYSKEDQQLEDLSQYPGQQDFRRGLNALGYIGNDWRVSQTLSAQSGDELKQSLLTSLEKGQTAISFEVKESVVSEIAVLEELHAKYPYSLNAKNLQADLLEQLSQFPDANEGFGYIGNDPIAVLIENGSENDSVEEDYNELARCVEKASQTLPEIKTILVNTIPYHNGGANAVQELAIAISTGVTHIEELLKRGLSLEKILSKLVFQFAVGANFFMEVAKLRAARILWSKITEAYGADVKNQGMVISAVTSSFTKSVYDPYVNMLRAGNEAFAAVLGGVQYLHVSPFNEPEGQASAFSNRIARNTQLILKEEAHLTKTADPAGGSWYVEKLTDELTEKSWNLFLDIEEKGGFIQALKQGYIQEQIEEIRIQRAEAVNTRKQTVVGTNKYANPADEPLNVSLKQAEQKNEKTWAIKPIRSTRLSESYEALRTQANALKESRKTPSVGLLTLGSLKDHKARTDFMTGFLTPGGVESVLSKEIHSFDDASAFISESGLKHFFICGSNDQYQEAGPKFVGQIKDKYPNIHLYLAGLPAKDEQEDWRNNGVEDFIHVRSNCYEILSSLLNAMEVGADE